MGVYIKDMEMPRNCEECGVKVVCKNYWKLIRTQYTRPSWCPLAPVPPHGRLIDADALIKELTLDDEDGNSGATLLMAIFLEVLKAAPTIIPAEGEK